MIYLASVSQLWYNKIIAKTHTNPKGYVIFIFLVDHWEWRKTGVYADSTANNYGHCS